MVKAFVVFLTFFLWFGKGIASQEYVIRMMPGAVHGIPPKEATDPRSLARRAVFESFRKKHPEIKIVHAGGFELSGMRGESGFLMSMAGETAPDIFYVNFRQYYNYIDQGFCQPLTGFIAKDPKVLSTVHPKIQEVLKSYNGEIYAMPWYQCAQSLYYRKDHFIQAGLDPNKPPRTWDEFYEYGKKLVESAPGRRGFSFMKGAGQKAIGMGLTAYHWSNFVWQAGGEIVEPAENGRWRSKIDSPEGAKALDFFRKLTTVKWAHPKTGEQAGPVAYVSSTFAQDVSDGKVSMWFGYTNDIMLAAIDLNPSLLGVARMPKGPGGYANEINAGMWAINSSVKDQKKREACWKFLKFFNSDEAARIQTEKFVELGLGGLVNPHYLKKFGYSDLAAQVDPNYVKANEQLFLTGHPEPYGKNCQQVYVVLEGALDRGMIDTKTPSRQILKDISVEMNRKLLGYTPPEILNRQRIWAVWILGLFVGLGAISGILVMRKKKKNQYEISSHQTEKPSFNSKKMGQNHKRIYRVLAICLLPALLSVILWSYYPLLKGLVIAFQDYTLLLGTKWVGVDNFIEVFTQPIFYKSVFNSFAFVALSILLGFFIPVFLALALNEIPKGAVFFRTLFYLPAMTSPILIALLWGQFYDRSETGLINRMLSPLIDAFNWMAIHLLGMSGPPIEKALDWLGNPVLAMFAVVLPGIWAAAGPGSILYLAALKNIPNERYEAADLDGADWKKKVFSITLPSLKPLIIINLLGVFVAGFKAMENIFVLTGGGPLYSTHTMGLEIWSNAFMFLKFGYATAAAWVMGAILIGFTLLQIRNMMNVRYTAAKL